MDERAQGVVLRVRPLTDSSLIVHWLTAEQGRLATVAKGARRPKSPFAGKLDLGFTGELGWRRSRRSDLHTLTEVLVTQTRPGMRGDYFKLSQAAYAVALVELATETETPVPEVFGLVTDFLDHLASGPAQARSIYALEAKLLAGEGLDPAASGTSLSADAQRLLANLVECSWVEIAALAGPPAGVGAVHRWLAAEMGTHWGRVPRGRASALGVAESGPTADRPPGP